MLKFPIVLCAGCLNIIKTNDNNSPRLPVTPVVKNATVSPWEKEDAQLEGIPTLNSHLPKVFVMGNSKLAGMYFE